MTFSSPLTTTYPQQKSILDPFSFSFSLELSGIKHTYVDVKEYVLSMQYHKNRMRLLENNARSYGRYART